MQVYRPYYKFKLNLIIPVVIFQTRQPKRNEDNLHFLLIIINKARFGQGHRTYPEFLNSYRNAWSI